MALERVSYLQKSRILPRYLTLILVILALHARDSVPAETRRV